MPTTPDLIFNFHFSKGKKRIHKIQEREQKIHLLIQFLREENNEVGGKWWGRFPRKLLVEFTITLLHMYITKFHKVVLTK